MDSSSSDLRVLILAPTGRDAGYAHDALSRAGIGSFPCSGLEELVEQLQTGAGAVLLAEEALRPAALPGLLALLEAQPPWSDLPLLLLTSDSPLRTDPREMEKLRRHGITLLERPMRVATLISATETALRARRRQYQVRALLEETSAAVRQRDEFLAMLGHELRNPLGAIRNALYLQTRTAPTPPPGETRLRAIIDHQSALLSHIVDELLDVSRVTTGKVVLDSHVVDLCDLAARCVQAIEPSIQAQQHRLRFTPCHPSLTVRGDAVRLEQVFSNLLTNAVKYTPPGGMIDFTIEPEGGQAVVRVRDTGIGIEAAMLPRIFELFTQVGTSIDRSRGGLGIGLTVVRRLVELHGGSIEVRSEGRGKGSDFTVRLPLAAAPADRTPEHPAVAASKKHRVLVIEDNADTRETLRELLSLWGHEVKVAPDGISGLELALAFRPEITLIDVGLPGLSGHEVARALRASPGGDRYFLVALTGYGQPEDRQRALEAGFDLHMVKPIDLDRLERLLAQAPPSMNGPAG